MRLLICTQTVDRRDPFASFFTEWIGEMAFRFSAVHVVCLKQGEYTPPENVTVRTLGKESMERATTFQRFRYTARVWRAAWRLRNEYDAVFIHQNQEYILIAGFLWWILGKPVYLWRNHYAGTILTDIAAWFCVKVFCTSRYSYTAKYKKTVLMPLGVNTDLFAPQKDVARTPHSILLFGRVAPSKRLDVVLDALRILHSHGISFTASIYGESLPSDAAYRKELQELVRKSYVANDVHFHAGVPHEEAPRIFREHEIYVNVSRSGMLDKTIFEAMATECVVLATSDDYKALVLDERVVLENADPEHLAEMLRELLTMPPDARVNLGRGLRGIVVAKHNLKRLGERLVEEIHIP